MRLDFFDQGGVIGGNLAHALALDRAQNWYNQSFLSFYRKANMHMGWDKDFLPAPGSIEQAMFCSATAVSFMSRSL